MLGRVNTGKNIIKNSDFRFGLEGWTNNNLAELAIENGKLKVTIKTDQSTPGIRTLNSITIGPGTYTFSMKADARYISPEPFLYMATPNLNQSHTTVTHQNGWSYYKCTFTIDKTVTEYFYVLVSKPIKDEHMVIDYIKLEKGSEATKHTMAPEDVASNPSIIVYSDIDKRFLLNPEEHYITNTATITIQVPYVFVKNKITIEDARAIIKNTKAAGVSAILSAMGYYEDGFNIKEDVQYSFVVGFSGLDSDSLIGGL